LSVRHYRSRKYGEKILIDIDFFKEKVEKNPVRLGCVFIGKIPKNKKEKCSIQKSNRLLLLYVLIENLIVGVGVSQVKEYFIKRSFFDFCKKINIVSRRVWLCLKIILKYTPFMVNLGVDSEDNARTIIDFLKRLPDSRM